jgi:hypothetical protein
MLLCELIKSREQFWPVSFGHAKARRLICWEARTRTKARCGREHEGDKKPYPHHILAFLSSTRLSLPVAVFGSASTKSISRGYL